jgi:hypothetical protein
MEYSSTPMVVPYNYTPSHQQLAGTYLYCSLLATIVVSTRDMVPTAYNICWLNLFLLYFLETQAATWHITKTRVVNFPVSVHE